MDYAALIGGLFNGAIQLYSMFKNGAELEAAKADLKNAFEQLNEQYKTGQIDAEQFKNAAIHVLSSDPVTASALRSNQMDALRQMSDVANAGGMDAQSLEQNAIAQNQYDQQMQQNHQAIANQYQRQGRWGSGEEIASQLKAGQDSANALRMSGLTNAANARKRALDALAQTGKLSTDIRAQDDALAERNRAAADQMAMFNEKMREAANSNYLRAKEYNAGLAQNKWNAAANYNNYLATGRAEQGRNAAAIGSQVQNIATGIGQAFNGTGDDDEDASGQRNNRGGY